VDYADANLGLAPNGKGKRKLSSNQLIGDVLSLRKGDAGTLISFSSKTLYSVNYKVLYINIFDS
jgi:hypothetical protein